MLSFKKKMPTNLLGVGTIIVFLLILFFMCRAQPPQEKLRWPTLLKKEIEELKADLARAKEDHQFDNIVHQKELESMRKK